MALMDKGSVGATYLIKALSEKSRSSNRLHQAIIEAALLTDDFERNAWTYAELIVFHLFHAVSHPGDGLHRILLVATVV